MPSITLRFSSMDMRFAMFAFVRSQSIKEGTQYDDSAGKGTAAIVIEGTNRIPRRSLAALFFCDKQPATMLVLPLGAMENRTDFQKFPAHARRATQW
jgi:hypothetical protein